MNQEIILPLLVPIITAILSIVFRKREKIRDYISFTGSLFYLVSVLLLSSKVFSSGAVSYQAGGWPAPFGITLVADHLSVLMLLLTASVSLAVNLYSWGYIDGQGKKSGYYSFLHFMLAGMSGAFVTGDLFNLFVMFEVVLMSSYAMVAYSGTGRSLFTSLKYVVLNRKFSHVNCYRRALLGYRYFKHGGYGGCTVGGQYQYDTGSWSFNDSFLCFCN